MNDLLVNEKDYEEVKLHRVGAVNLFCNPLQVKKIESFFNSSSRIQDTIKALCFLISSYKDQLLSDGTGSNPDNPAQLLDAVIIKSIL